MNWLDDILYWVGPILIVVLVLGVVLSGVAFVVCRVESFSDLAKLDRLRIDAARVSGCESEAVYGRVAEMNGSISLWKAQNRIWWLGWCVPDVWGGVEYLEMGK